MTVKKISWFQLGWTWFQLQVVKPGQRTDVGLTQRGKRANAGCSVKMRLKVRKTKPWKPGNSNQLSKKNPQVKVS